MSLESIHGTIIKGYSGFYYVLAVGQQWECRLRGKHKLGQKDFLPGDMVVVSQVEPGKGIIEDVLPRKNRLIRPPVANVDQVVIVTSLAESVTDLMLIDRLLVLSKAEQINGIIVLNKTDLVPEQISKAIAKLYEHVCPVVITSAKRQTGIDQLRSYLSGKISVFAGPSGVGKSSLLNAVQHNLSLKTGDVSSKTGRGKHTTRHVSLLQLDSGGMVADTPGFSRLDLPDIELAELASLFPDLLRGTNRCKFRNCLHDREPGCAVKEAVDNGEVAIERYGRYLKFLEELRVKELKH